MTDGADVIPLYNVLDGKHQFLMRASLSVIGDIFRLSHLALTRILHETATSGAECKLHFQNPPISNYSYIYVVRAAAALGVNI